MIALALLGLTTCCLATDLTDLPAHNKPFGWGSTEQVAEIEGFPPVKEFFEKYARKNIPVVMRGANKVWPGYTNWQTDEYFKSVAPEEPYMVSLDRKKGNPDGDSKYVDFKEFVDNYKTSNRRMVEKTPSFLWSDVKVPRCLDCDVITSGQILMGNKMWYGYNYTTSVVHKDAADNINCLVYGVKNYTMVSRDQSHLVHLDRPDGLFSTMNVDKVNLKKYPGLEQVHYQISELHGGDCIFVPYKWIHQVRSYGRNIAVNIWWNYWKDNDVDVSTCEDNPKQDNNINTATFHGWADFESKEDGVLEHLTDLIRVTRKDMNFVRYALLFTLGVTANDEDVMYIDEDLLDALRKAFKAMDVNKDGKVNYDELVNLPEKRMKKVIKHMRFVFFTTRVRASNAMEMDKTTEFEKKTGKTVDPNLEQERPVDFDYEAEAKRQQEELEKIIKEKKGAETVSPETVGHDEF